MIILILALLLAPAEKQQAVLSEKLVLQIDGGGIKGVQITTWAIQPNGEWAKVINDGLIKTKKSVGRLTPESLSEIAEMANSQEVRNLPETIGTIDKKLNPASKTIKYGRFKSVAFGDIKDEKVLKVFDKFFKLVDEKLK